MDKCERAGVLLLNRCRGCRSPRSRSHPVSAEGSEGVWSAVEYGESVHKGLGVGQCVRSCVSVWCVHAMMGMAKQGILYRQGLRLGPWILGSLDPWMLWRQQPLLSIPAVSGSFQHALSCALLLLWPLLALRHARGLGQEAQQDGACGAAPAAHHHSARTQHGLPQVSHSHSHTLLLLNAASLFQQKETGTHMLRRGRRRCLPCVCAACHYLCEHLAGL